MDCGEPTGRVYARFCDPCRREHTQAIGKDLWVDRFGQPGHWTRERIIEAIQEWAKKYGEPPTMNDWRKKAKATHTFGEPPKRTWPRASHVDYHFGSWAAAIEAAGFTPRSLRREGNSSRPNGKTCRNGLHAWIPENIRTARNGDRRCRLCENERQREYQQRKRAKA